MNLKKMLTLILALAMVFSMAAAMTGCKNNEEAEEPTEATTGESVTHTIKIQSKGGMALEGLEV